MKKTLYPVNYTLVKAPYIHRSATFHHEASSSLTIFDIHLLQPNSATLPSGVIHTLDHLLTPELANHLVGLISLAPLSCQTGYALTVWGEPPLRDIHQALKKSLNQLKLQSPTLTLDAENCSNYRNIAHQATLTYIKELLEQGISINPYIKS